MIKQAVILAKSPDEDFPGMIVDPAQKLDVLRTVSFVDCVVHDEYVEPLFIRQRNELSVDNAFGEQERETRPVDVHGVEEPIEGVFCSKDGASCTEGFEQFFVDEGQLEELAKDSEHRNAFCLVGSALLQKRAQFEGAEEGLRDGGDFIFNGDSLCYAVHGMDLQGIVFLDNTILPERLPCRFLFLARYPVCKMQAPFLLPFFNAKVE